jgi:hypothetical protein
MGALVGVVLWNKRKSGTRNPFGRDLKLLRMPGEHLWQRVNRKDMTEMQWTIALMLMPIIVAGLALQIASAFFGKTYVSLVIALGVFLFTIPWCIAWLAGRLERRERQYLGFFGERLVADCLEPLKEKGWFIFHDVPCDGASKKFNLDHVAVGPGGLWIVETKVRRKGRARRGMDRHKVRFDGTKIMWPRWDDTGSIRQAVKSAEWLQEWLERATQKTFAVSVVVVTPGYEVESIGKSGVSVAAPKDLLDVLIGQGTILSAEEIKMIRLPLAGKCRDVEY